MEEVTGDKELEKLLQNPPSLQDVLKDALLHKLFYWHLVSVFAPEVGCVCFGLCC